MKLWGQCIRYQPEAGSGTHGPGTRSKRPKCQRDHEHRPDRDPAWLTQYSAEQNGQPGIGNSHLHRVLKEVALRESLAMPEKKDVVDALVMDYRENWALPLNETITPTIRDNSA